jgi:predicted Zn-dependent protease
MNSRNTVIDRCCKDLLPCLALVLLSFCLISCSTNPATGEQQLSLMSEQQEMKIGASEHSKVVKTIGLVKDRELSLYVQSIGKKVAQNTERANVAYNFYVLDTPMVNAFALPGGYVYVTRGLLALANSEAEIAGVIAHEIAHVTARHSAERYSHGLLSSIGALAISLATDSAAAARLAGIGSDLYIKSYSRSQEHQADELAIRYLHRAGYDTFAMRTFLETMEIHTALENKIDGKSDSQFYYFSTHPLTTDRIMQTTDIAGQYPANGAAVGRTTYLKAIDGMTYGDSAAHGFIRGQHFYHPELGFTFHVPKTYELFNQPDKIVAVDNKAQGVMVFDMVGNKSSLAPVDYITRQWAADKNLRYVETIDINGYKAATAEFTGTLKGQQRQIRIFAIAWKPDRFIRIQMAVPEGLSAASLDELKIATYSVRAMSEQERREIRPYSVRIRAFGPDDTIERIARRMPFTSYQVERFQALNGMRPGERPVAGRLYKTIEP